MFQCCEILRINGLVTHELGCTESWRNQEKACFECGCGFVPVARFDKVCPGCVEWENEGNDCA